VSTVLRPSPPARSAPRTRAPALDAVCAAAVDLALAAAEDVAGIGRVGEHLTMSADGDRLVTHYFRCLEPGYVGWRWAVTVARAPRTKLVTVDETVLLPGDDALLAPAWLPWSERLRPGDLGAGDLLPTAEDDPRLVPGFTGEDEREPEPDHADEFERRDSLPFISEEVGFGRVRVLSAFGRDDAADRWYAGEHGPRSPVAQAAPARCATCGFLTPLAGVLRQSFGVCANEFSPSDGRVVAFDHGCGAHSEAAIVPGTADVAAPVLDELAVEPVRLHPTGSVDEAEDTETDPGDLGHS
jgi:hypothetical protein